MRVEICLLSFKDLARTLIFFIFFLEDLEAAERITISRKFKDDVVRPILKVGLVQVNVKRYEGFL